MKFVNNLFNSFIFILSYLMFFFIGFIIFDEISFPWQNSYQPVLNNVILTLTLFFGLFLIIPFIAAYFISFKLLKTRDYSFRKRDKLIPIGIASIILITLGFQGMRVLSLSTQSIRGPRLIQVSDSTFHNKILPTQIPSQVIFPKVTISLTPTNAQNTPTPTLTPSPTNTPMPTLTPTRTPNPPIINISYPSEMQSVEFTNPSQQFCVVDTPAGGDTTGLQRKHSINDGDWTSYVDEFTLCFDPKEGMNRFNLQYKNKYGDESVIYTRQFTFHKAY